ncbi:MAG: DUF6183 family protein [Acidimicrobiales bacterium]
MAPRLTVAELLDLGDLDGLLRRIDDLCDAREWPALLDLRDRCRTAFELAGRQLWPAASHAEYRLALEAPGRWAAAVVEPGAGRFALGPLSEVAASTHTWDELAPHLASTPEAALVAQERVLRGEDLRGEDVPLTELPLVLQDWEPTYRLATYEHYKRDVPSLDVPVLASPAAVHQGEVMADPDATDALLELVTPWTTQSNGHARALAIEGNAAGAVAALGIDRHVLAEIDTASALALMAWTAASGGAHGRRRGAALGRFSAWWTVAALAGALDDWPDIEPALDDLRWYRWDRIEHTTGWSLRLAAERPADGLAFAVEATDTRDP